MLSTDLISTILPTPDLSNINAGELENDMSLLLNWIKLSPQPMTDPTPRIKSCIKSILKDESSQYQFTKLLNNSINGSFEVIGYDRGSVMALDIHQFIPKLIKTRKFYDDLLISLGLNLNPDCLNIYNRNLNKNLKLIVKEDPVLIQLQEFFDQNFLQLKDWNRFDIIPILKFFEVTDLLDELSQILITVVIQKIKLFITDRFILVWNLPILQQLNDFISFKIYPNIEFVLNHINLEISFNDLIKIGYNELTSVRINEIYKIIMNYPSSEISLIELNKCLNFQSYHQVYDHTEHHQRNKLVEVFTNDTKMNLLNSGITTIHLIQSYIKIIKSFLILDPKGVLLDKVIRPVRKYLKSRDDIINKLVLGLLDKEPQLADLSKELKDTEKNFKFLKAFDDLGDLNWVPDPIDALPDFKKFKINDIIQSLISIFESKEIFIIEFTKLFGNKLINKEEDLSTIVNLINLLKLRFGKNEFFNLDIMVQDFTNSQSNAITMADTNVSVLILSHLYWSDILEEASFVLHPKLLKLMDWYNNDIYAHHYSNRYLKVVANFGTVKLDLNGKEYRVSLDKGSVLLMFDGCTDPVSVGEIGEVLKMSEYLVGKCLEFWVKEEVVTRVTSVLYVINE